MNERTWHITVAKIVAVIGFIVACTTLNVGARYFAMSTFASGVYAVNSVILGTLVLLGLFAAVLTSTSGWVSSTCGQTKEKRACALAIGLLPLKSFQP
jgi:MFS transporter, ACS family, DAL5 transporter family protein